ncbi:DEAD/DEAH box helicase family protein [Egicoccus halophilus]|uniref:DNA-repair protein n=1 Tax=Egicoccus halophilus TaxID=1670830 RepID=A0A8J3AAZ4_9ACTN|nr:DEAD/DEAH box helicase family protein [Egicoccus halophilus]GGI09359.1 DNA-repair protein [Egicoccus halophilus]
MGLPDLDLGSRTYRLPRDPLVSDVLNPCFAEAYRVRGQFAYFTSHVLGQVSAGLTAFLAREDEPPPIEFVVSPWLSDQDAAAVLEAAADPRRVLEDVLRMGLLRAPRSLTVDAVEEHTLRCFAWLLASNRLRLDIAVVPGGRFHEKTWEFSDRERAEGHNGHVVYVAGSANATRQALRVNSESMSVFPSWVAGTEGHVGPLRESFSDVFEGRSVPLYPMSDALLNEWIETWKSDFEPTEEDLERAARKVGDLWLIADPVAKIEVPHVSASDGEPFIPEWLNWTRPPYEHQREAVLAWEAAGRRGVMEMATGAGKTWTALVSAVRAHYETEGPTLLTIAVPFTPLLHQWAEDCSRFGIDAALPTASSGSRLGKFSQLNELISELTLGARSFGCVIVTHHLLGDPEFDALVQDAADLGVATMLVGDEVHRLGATRFISDPPEGFAKRLGLSATPSRQYDVEGTTQMYGYFGDTVFEYGLDQAIGSCLVEYDYYVEVVRLNWDEVEEFNELTRKIGAAYRPNATFSENPAYAAAVRRRRAFLDTAAGKLPALARALERYGPSPLSHTLIYSSARESSQLGEVQDLLDGRNVSNARITYQETPNLHLVQEIVERFRAGEIAVLNAMKVLDEGFNIPEITTAFLFSSTGTEREWTQRRGRVLRMAPGKGRATIVDFVVLPPADAEPTPAAQRYIDGELVRIEAFARFAANQHADDGAARVITQLLRESTGGQR